MKPTIGQVRTVLLRQLPNNPSKEHLLWMNVLTQAISDLGNKKLRYSTAQFIASERCAYICDLIGVCQDFVIECASKFVGKDEWSALVPLKG